jgi:DNA-binding IclR family transcriptional regulator
LRKTVGCGLDAPAENVPQLKDSHMNANVETNDQKKSGGRSIRRAFSVLEAIAHEPEGLTLAELSRTVGLHTSTTFHLLRTLAPLGCVRRDEITKKYFVGTRMFALAAGAADEIELVNVCTPPLEALARETGETSHLAVRSNDIGVIIAKFDGSASVRTTERIGTEKPAHATAIGKIILAAIREAELERYLASHPLKAYTEKTLTDPALLKAEVEKVRRRGVAFDDCEFNLEIRCIAAPIHDFASHTVGSVGISGPMWRIDLLSVGGLEEQVREAARVISAKLGYPESGTRAAVAEAKRA